MVWFWDEGADPDSKVIHPLDFGLEGELASIMVFFPVLLIYLFLFQRGRKFVKVKIINLDSIVKDLSLCFT